MDNHYFLKCSNCGYLTEIISENHSWCPNCTQRFVNYYKLWKRQNPDGNLKKYQLEVCIMFTSYDIKTSVNPQNRKKEILNPSEEVVIRRRYIKEGIPLDRGGHMIWDKSRIKWHYIPLLIIALLILLVILFD